MSCAEAAPELEQLWVDSYKPGATGSSGAYAGKSYWVASYDWSKESPPIIVTYPFADSLYSVALTSGFATGYTPTFAIIGYNNKVYFDAYTLTNFTTALNLAIDEFVHEGPFVDNPVPDKYFVTDFNQDIDLNNVFEEYNGNLMTFEIINNSDPLVCNVSLSDSILTISSNSRKVGETVIQVKALSGDNSATEEFKVMINDPTAFAYLENSFESSTFPPPFWEIKYNTLADTLADGSISGANLTSPLPGETTWIQNKSSSTSFGSEYIHSGDNSVLIDFWAIGYNWLIMPEMQLDFNDYNLMFWLYFTCDYYETKFHVLVNDGTGWQSIKDYDRSVPNNNYDVEESLSLSAYAGKTIRIAFVYEYTDGYELALDDIRVYSPSGINSDNLLTAVELYQNYPNPFNPSTTISFKLNERSDVKLSVFNYKGEFISNVFSGKLDQGYHDFMFNADKLTSGVYYYTLESDGSRLSNKMLLIK